MSTKIVALNNSQRFESSSGAAAKPRNVDEFPQISTNFQGPFKLKSKLKSCGESAISHFTNEVVTVYVFLNFPKRAKKKSNEIFFREEIEFKRWHYFLVDQIKIL